MRFGHDAGCWGQEALLGLRGEWLKSLREAISGEKRRPKTGHAEIDRREEAARDPVGCPMRGTPEKSLDHGPQERRRARRGSVSWKGRQTERRKAIAVVTLATKLRPGPSDGADAGDTECAASCHVSPSGAQVLALKRVF